MVAESRKNMRVDMRLAVLSRTMPKELFLACIAVGCVVSMPLYFYKVKPLQRQRQEQLAEQRSQAILKEENQRIQERTKYVKQNYRTDLNISTADKALRLSD